MTQISRRSVAKGAAWSVPVVAVGAATPASAASLCEPTFSVTGESCKCPGQSTNIGWGYYLQICATLVCQPVDFTDSITIHRIENGSQKELLKVSDPEGTYPFDITLTSEDCAEGVEFCGCTEELEAFFTQSSAEGLRVLYSYTGVLADAVWSQKYSTPPDCVECGTGNQKECYEIGYECPA